MCLPEKIAAWIKSAETMEVAWVRLDAWFKDEGAFIKDLMQDIRSVSAIKDGDDERLMDYYWSPVCQSRRSPASGPLIASRRPTAASRPSPASPGADPEAANGAVALLPPREAPAAVRRPPAARAARAAELPFCFCLCSTHTSSLLL
jgi:hypothetical protein